MSLKRIFLLSLILLSVSLASPFSVELSLSGGLQHIYTNSDLFNNDPSEIRDESTDNIFLIVSLKPAVSCFCHNTGIYLSADKPFGHNYFNRYFILSGGFKQRLNISDKKVMDVHLGTTWHSVEAAINSIWEFYTSFGFISLPGLDIGVDYRYKLSDKTALLLGANYNFNLFSIDFPETVDTSWKFRIISLNAGLMFSLQ
jgi:hypothetical protein